MNKKITSIENLELVVTENKELGAIGMLSSDDLIFFKGQLKFIDGRPAGYWRDVMIAGKMSDIELAKYVESLFDISAEEFLKKLHWFGLPCVYRPHYNCP